jgi:hypothetical protein
MAYESRGSRGFGSLMFSVIPAAIAGAAILWLIAITGVIDLTSQLRQERRAAERVGIVVMPKVPIKLTINEDTCVKVDKSFLDGSTLTFYVVNHCHYGMEYVKDTYRIIAPDGTVIKSDFEFLTSTGDVLQPNERREVTRTITMDDRTVEINLQLHDGQKP